MTPIGSPVRAVLYAFAANLGIALSKTVAFVLTSSSSILAEAIHSYADTANQLLLLMGMSGARRPPDAEHPLGYGKLSYFWSFIVALLLFSAGGVFSVYEGWYKLASGGEIANTWIALGVLILSILLEASSMYGCLSEVNRVRRGQSLWAWLERSRNAELVVVFGEDLSALVGLGLALLFVLLATLTGDNRYDAYGSIAIGAVLISVSIFIAIRIKSLLIGRSADPDLREAIQRHIGEHPEILEVFNVITIQIGPDVMLAAKIRLQASLDAAQASLAINRLERDVKLEFPEIKWCFVEPDVVA